ncbi:hypothetical protein N7508_002164 [Penicillium antarcticum]|uniref:uncharacterized protein n=1 Tax=Penicillium antarcticum TaxID=416450 RepID=UPI0023A14C40|nr:uncharacterized protein N7508_002164 [Penicillium antarcticum]KAJ5317656.1 hypothetical protein N7508_002164 [Penicillium antarcticum]
MSSHWGPSNSISRQGQLLVKPMFDRKRRNQKPRVLQSCTSCRRKNLILVCGLARYHIFYSFLVLMYLIQAEVQSQDTMR